MSLTLDPSRLNKRITFGTMQSVKQPNGVSKPQFVAQFTVWGTPWTRSLAQSYQLIGTALEDTNVLVIRHNQAVTSSLAVQLDGQTYRIVSVNPDESSSLVTYDMITVKRVSK